MFFLALTFGLRDDPPGRCCGRPGFIEAAAAQHGIEPAVQMTVATSDGVRVRAFRYSTERNSPSLFYSTDARTLRELHPDNLGLGSLSDETRLVVSEPLITLHGAWNEMPESTYGIIREGRDAMKVFHPQWPG